MAAKKAATKKTATKKPATKKPATKKAAAKKPKLNPDGSIKKARSVIKPKSATGAYTQTEFIENLQAFCGLEKKSEAKAMAEDIALLLTESLKKGYKVPLFGLAKLQVKKSKARMGVNPATREKIKIPAKKKVKFTATKALKDTVL